MRFIKVIDEALDSVALNANEVLCVWDNEDTGGCIVRFKNGRKIELSEDYDKFVDKLNKQK